MSTDVLSAFEKSVSDSLQSAERAAGNVGADAANEIAKAVGHPLSSVTRGSFLGSDGKLHGPLADAFGSDPVTFAINGVKSQYAKCVDLANRCASRLETASIKAKDSRGVSHTVSLKVNHKSSVAEVVASLCASSIHSPSVVGDELNRLVLGFPVGKRDSGVINTRPRGTGAEIPIILAVIGLLVVIAPLILPPILALLTGGVAAIGDIAKPKPKPTGPLDGALFGVPIPLIAAAAVGVVLIVVFKGKKKHGSAAPAPGATA